MLDLGFILSTTKRLNRKQMSLIPESLSASVASHDASPSLTNCPSDVTIYIVPHHSLHNAVWMLSR